MNERSVPIFVQRLKDIRCCDGDRVHLVCVVDGQPLPEVFWEKDGKLLDEEIGNICTSFDGEHASLIINGIYPEDEGEYTCVAKNNLGQTSTSAVIVIDVYEENSNLVSQQLHRPSGLLSPNSTPRSTPRSTPIRSMSPALLSYRSTSINLTDQRHQKFMSPKFYAIPHGRVAEEGETVTFQCAIAGHPTPWATWDKDGQIVTPTTRISVKERDDLRVLEINEVTFDDAGLYRVTLENEYGRIEATARLDIISNNRGGTRQGIRANSSSRRGVSTSRRLMGSSTRIGGRLVLSTISRGTSVPARRFYHNAEEIDLSNPRYELELDSSKATLFINDVRKSDEGIYTCISENQDGIVSSSTYITFFNDENEIVKQAPEFVRPLESMKTTEGCQFIDLICQVQSFTPFDIQWKRNGKFIDPTDDDFW